MPFWTFYFQKFGVQQVSGCDYVSSQPHLREDAKCLQELAKNRRTPEILERGRRTPVLGVSQCRTFERVSASRWSALPAGPAHTGPSTVVRNQDCILI